MNKERMISLASYLRTEVTDEQFNMEGWASKAPCGTTGCIAGHALVLAGDPVFIGWLADPHAPTDVEDYARETVDDYTEEDGYVWDAASAYLGLSMNQSCQLFFAKPRMAVGRHITRTEAADLIMEMVEKVP